MRDELKELKEFNKNKYKIIYITVSILAFLLFLPFLFSYACYDNSVVSMLSYVSIILSVIIIMICNIALLLTKVYGLSFNHFSLVFLNAVYYIMMYNMACYTNYMVYIVVFVSLLVYHYFLNMIYPMIGMIQSMISMYNLFLK